MKIDDETLKKMLFGLLYLRSHVRGDEEATAVLKELIDYIEDHFGIKE